LLLAAVVCSHAAVGIDLPVAHQPGTQLVRASIPWPAEADPRAAWTAATGPATIIPVATRPLSWRTTAGGTQVPRRVLVSFPYRFADTNTVHFRLQPASAGPASGASDLPAQPDVDCDGRKLVMRWPGGGRLDAEIVAPALTGNAPVRITTVESNRVVTWTRYHIDDPAWPRVIEIRRDALGRVTAIARVQRREGTADGFAPRLGWQLEADAMFGAPDVLETDVAGATAEDAIGRDQIRRHAFKDGVPARVRCGSGRWVLEFPTAHWKRRGGVAVSGSPNGGLRCDYERVADGERVPMQPWGWQRFEFSVAPAGRALLTATLEEPCRVRPAPDAYERLYEIAPAPTLPAGSVWVRLLEYNREAIRRSAAVGDDWGNVTSYSDGSPHGGSMGMNRLNHGPAIFEEAWHTGDQRLRETALLWCENFIDQTVWWGPKATGGTRYNNVRAQNRTPLTEDYMWRSNDSVHFCTKGYDAFYLAFEETGDPRFLEALEAQVAYAAENIHVDRGEARNVGDVRDFIRLHAWTGDPRYLQEALRLFRELRGVVGPGGLFSQSGALIEPNPPFIDDDATGYHHPFAKPYIIGYALAGLPDLAFVHPDEPRLREVIQAVADFLADSQDPAGAWRYPHPRSAGAIASQALEHAWQIVQADRFLGPNERHLDAIERVLRQRLHGWLATGHVLSGYGGWELATHWVSSPEALRRLYRKPEDRDFARDYAEGTTSFGSAPPEGLVYLSEVLEFYLRHRPIERLNAPPRPGQPLARLLDRLSPAERVHASEARPPQTLGVTNSLPTFADRLSARLTFPGSWLSGRATNFADWQRETRARVLELLGPPPPVVPFDVQVLAEIDRGTHVARKLALNLTGDSRVLGYCVQPKGPGPFPAVLLLHDHGAKFDIGKEKVIEPWDVPAATLESARQWVTRYYGGRFLGDELARRGYVCFATDALNWGDRGGAGYDGQQALAANLLQLGTSFAALIAQEDLRAAEFLATQPAVDPRRVAAMGLSMGCFRTWQVAALSDRIRAGVAICWMATVKGLMTAGNNQTRGQSAFTMTHPGLFNLLDYSDVASLACPKPMLFYNGEQDALFPVPSVLEAHEKLRRVWQSQGALDRLELRLWDAPHEFNRAMQDAAFDWLDARIGVRSPHSTSIGAHPGP
jgi:dienelactone hydrolase